MGTLFNQPSRMMSAVDVDEVRSLLENAIKLSNELYIDLDKVLTAYHIKELERRNDLYVRNADVLDEQLAGFGELLQQLTATLEKRDE